MYDDEQFENSLENPLKGVEEEQIDLFEFYDYNKDDFLDADEVSDCMEF